MAKSRAPGRVTLHGEIEAILLKWGAKGMKAPEIARILNERGRYRRQDGSPVPPNQIHARVSKHPQLFERRQGRIFLRGQ